MGTTTNPGPAASPRPRSSLGSRAGLQTRFLEGSAPRGNLSVWLRPPVCHRQGQASTVSPALSPSAAASPLTHTGRATRIASDTRREILVYSLEPAQSDLPRSPPGTQLGTGAVWIQPWIQGPGSGPVTAASAKGVPDGSPATSHTSSCHSHPGVPSFTQPLPPPQSLFP